MAHSLAVGREIDGRFLIATEFARRVVQPAALRIAVS
jgi:hypothetical protein